MNGNQNKGPRTEENAPLKTNTWPIVRIGFFVLVFGFGAFLLWAFLAPLGEGVVANGEVTVVTNKKTIQHQYGGTIEEILVKEGARVKREQVLIRLNDTQPKANLTTIRGEYFLALATEARLLAERRRAPKILFPQQMTALAHLPDIANLMKTQDELFSVRRGSLMNEINILRENIEGLQEYISRIEELQHARAQQMELLTAEMNSLKDMVEQGYYPRTRLIEMERMRAELSGRRSEDLGNIARTRKTINEYKITIVRRDQEYMKEVEALLGEVQRKTAAARDHYAATLDVLEKTEIRAPEEGVVVGLTVHTPGGVITPGQRIMDIVPANAELIVEAKVSTADIERVHNNQMVDLRFTAFDVRKTPVIEGEVILVSADRFTDELTKMPYYLCRVKITPEGLRDLGDRQLQPGMPVQAVIKVSQRTLMDYLIKPLVDRIAVSFQER
jgi:HlyD family type I secretion membrane fusion protein